MRSNETAVAPRSAASRSTGSTTASVVRTTSIVARAGASMPAPLAMPETDQPCPPCDRDLVHGVGRLDRDGRVLVPVRRRGRRRRRRPRRAILSIGSSSPMRPVEQTTTSPAETPRTSATCSAVRCVSRKPWVPVQALAPPELRTTASTRPSATTWRDHVTGAASTRLVVKTAAAWWSGPSLTTSARSGVPLALSPAVTPAARKPAGRWTGCGPLTVRLLRSGGRGSRRDRGRGWRTARRRRRCPW